MVTALRPEVKPGTSLRSLVNGFVLTKQTEGKSPRTVEFYSENLKRSYWYAYEWIYRKWRGFSKEMFKLGESITACEHELIHGITDFKQRLDYMNWRLIGATLDAVRAGLPITELVQF